MIDGSLCSKTSLQILIDGKPIETISARSLGPLPFAVDLSAHLNKIAQLVVRDDSEDAREFISIYGIELEG